MDKRWYVFTFLADDGGRLPLLVDLDTITAVFPRGSRKNQSALFAGADHPFYAEGAVGDVAVIITDTKECTPAQAMGVWLHNEG